MINKDYLKTLVNKTVRLSKKLDNGYNYYYEGIILKINEFDFILNEKKLGIIILPFENIDIIFIQGDF